MGIADEVGLRSTSMLLPPFDVFPGRIGSPTGRLATGETGVETFLEDDSIMLGLLGSMNCRFRFCRTALYLSSTSQSLRTSWELLTQSRES